jgi:hypothetical protein
MNTTCNQLVKQMNYRNNIILLRVVEIFLILSSSFFVKENSFCFVNGFEVGQRSSFWSSLNSQHQQLSNQRTARQFLTSPRNRINVFSSDISTNGWGIQGKKVLSNACVKHAFTSKAYSSTSSDFEVVQSTDLSSTNAASSFDPNTIEFKSQVLNQLKNIIDPDLNADIVTLG